MINIVIVFIGIVLMIYAVGECLRLRKITSEIDVPTSMNFVLGLIIFFLLGYIAYAIYLINQANHQTIDFLMSLILFFGSIFVVIVKKTNYQLICTLSLKNKEISDNNQQLSAKQKELEQVKIQLEKKNTQLGKTLDDIYTLQLDAKNDPNKPVS